MFKNIIFDWSGVVKDSARDTVWVVNKMMESLGGDNKISFEEFRETWEQPYMNFWKKYYPNLTLQEEQKLYYEVIARKDCPRAQVYPGIVELIMKLKASNISMAVLSGDPEETFFPEIKEFGLENIFKELVLNVHDKAEKIHELVSKNRFNKEETVFIGDSNHEVEVGKQAGIKTIAVTWGFSTEKRLKSMKPDFLVHNIKELEKVLLK